MENITNKIAAYFEERQVEQLAAKEQREAVKQAVKAYPLQAVSDFAKVKNGDTEGLPPDMLNFYSKATVADMEGYLAEAEAENSRIIKLTESERFLHNRAAIRYESKH